MARVALTIEARIVPMRYLLVVRVLVTTDACIVPMRRAALAVHVRSLRSTNVTVGIDVHVQAAELHSEQTQASGKHNRRARTAHGAKFIT